MFAAGVDFITSGNHIWDKREFRGALDETDRILRPGQLSAGLARPRRRDVHRRTA